LAVATILRLLLGRLGITTKLLRRLLVAIAGALNRRTLVISAEALLGTTRRVSLHLRTTNANSPRRAAILRVERLLCVLRLGRMAAVARVVTLITRHPGW
jgi:hypothetical protein